ncbi:hypothetical protein GC163_07010 [bacterium]|nr:hypothetical protein [bacterium]
MTSATLPAPPPTLSRKPQSWGIAVLACLWCGILVTLVFLDSNPVVLNPVQVQAATFVVQGTLSSSQPPQLTVTRVWKGELAAKTLAITGELPVALPQGEVIVPLSRGIEPGSYIVTQGPIPNFPRKMPPREGEPAGRMSHVQPFIYPATAEVIEQLQALLPSSP